MIHIKKASDFPKPIANSTDSTPIGVLQDIAQNVRIKSDFCIEHPKYKPFEPPVEIVKRLQQLPIETRNKYLSQQLQSFLYGIYYNGSLTEELLSDRDINTLVPKRDLENNTWAGIDREFYQQLHTSNSGKGYFDWGWQVVGIDDRDGSLIVAKNGLTLHMEIDPNDKERFTQLIGNGSIYVRLPKNKIQNGFYVAVGNAGLYSSNTQNGSQDIVRIYFNLTSQGAPKILNSLTEQLNKAFIPFNFKTLYNPDDYSKRCDCAVLYFNKENYGVIKQVLKSIYLKHQAHFQDKIPLFTKMLATGLALAEEPAQKFSEQESFGQNRCQIIANGLLEAEQQKIDNLQARVATIINSFSSLKIDPEHPYLNANSENIYTNLDL